MRYDRLSVRHDDARRDRIRRPPRDVGGDQASPLFRSSSPRSSSLEISGSRGYPYVEGWPTVPKPISRFSPWAALSKLQDVVAVVASLAFLALAIAILYLGDKPTGSRTGVAVEEASKLAPTVFPIVFAAVVGKGLALIGRLRAERGVELGTLRCLLSTKTVSDAVQNHVVFRDFGATSVAVFLLWALSPVGSQASLRALAKVNRTSEATVPVRYVDSGPLGQVFAGEWNVAQSDALNSGRPGTVADAYSAALMQTLDDKLGPRDAWGNVKIPRIEGLAGSAPDGDGWFDATALGEVEAYAGLFGLPVAGLPPTGAVRFPVETSYVSLTCSAPGPLGDDGGPALPNGLDVTCATCALNTTLSNDIQEYPERRAIWSARAAFFVGERSPNSTEAADPRFTDANVVRFLSRTPDNEVVSADCAVEQTLVESRIECVRGDCAATKVRRSVTDRRGSNYTVFDYWGKVVLDEVTLASQHGRGGLWSSASEFFISNSSRLPLVAESLGDLQQLTDLGAVAPEAFAARASMLLNTFVQLWLSGSAFAGELSTNLSSYGPAHLPADGLADFPPLAFGRPNSPASGDVPDGMLAIFRDAPFVGASADATHTTYEEVYEPVLAWLVLLFVASVTMSATGIVGVACGFGTRAPDRFDPVVGQTYDNPYFDRPPGGSALDVADRARLLRDVRVRVGNVNPDGGVGKLGFATEENARPVKSATLYE